MPKSYFEQYVEYRLMDFKFSTIGQDSHGINNVIEQHIHSEDNPHLKQVCAKLPVPLVEKLDSVINQLDISKRKFIQLALIEAIEKVETLERDIDIFEFVDKSE